MLFRLTVIYFDTSNHNFNRKGISFGEYDMVYTGTNNHMSNKFMSTISMRKLNDINEQSIFYNINHRKRNILQTL